MSNFIRWYSKNSTNGHYQDFIYKDGCVFEDNLSEELDNSTIIINKKDKINFEPFDQVEVFRDENICASIRITALYYQRDVSKDKLQLGLYAWSHTEIVPTPTTVTVYTKTLYPQTTTPLYKANGSRDTLKTISRVTYNDVQKSLGTMLIDNSSESQVSFSPDKFDYTLSLMSKTKLLERIILPNFSVTKPLGGTAKTLAQVIQILIDDYCPKYFIGNEYKAYITVEDNNDLTNTPCPDMQMTRPTLREAIDRVLSVIKCIGKLDDNGVIHVFYIERKGNEINLTDNTKNDYVGNFINYKNENQGSSDYASVLDNIYTNVVPNNDIFNINNTTEVTEYIGFRNINDGVVADDNLFVETRYPIYNIKKVIMCCYHETGVQVSGLFQTKYDITGRVKESQDYDKLDFGNISPVDGYATKVTCVYYTRGDNKILNWSTNYKPFLSANFFVIQNIWKSVYKEHYGVIPRYGKLSDIRKKVSFIITYDAQVDSIRASSGKLLPETHENNSIIDNVGEAFVDIYQQGKLFNQKVNRLGNRAKNITGRFPKNKIHLIPQLGDYIGDFIVMNRELQYYDNFVLYKATLTENFVNINYFTGINARRRSWQIVSAEEAFNKQLLDKYYCEFSFSSKIGLDNSVINDETIHRIDYLAKDLSNYFSNSSYYIKNTWISNQYIKDNNNQVSFHELETQKFVSGNSLIFTFGMYDNFSSSQPVIVRDQNEDSAYNEQEHAGGISEYWNKYTNDLGNCDYTTIVFTTNVIYPAIGYWYDKISNIINMNEWEHISIENIQKGGHGGNIPYIDLYSGFKPRVYWPYIENNKYVFNQDESYFSTRIYNHKDSREKLSFNVQFEFCTDTKDIIFTKEFLSRNKMISTIAHDSDYKIYASTNKITYQDNEISTSENTYTELTGATIFSHITNNNSPDASAYYQLTIPQGVSIPSHQSFIITTTPVNGIAKIIMAVNTTEDNPIWYLNVLRNRDRKVYTDNSMKEWN